MMKTIYQSPATFRVFPIFPVVLALALGGLWHVAQADSLRFLPLNEEVAGRKIGLQDGKGLVELKGLNPKKRSKAYALVAGGGPPVLAALDRERPGGKPAGVELLVAAEMKAPLVLILADPDHPSGMRAIVIEDGAAGFPWGSLRFVNTADKPLMIRCGKETLAIPKSPGVIDIAPGGEARNIGVQLYAEEEPDAVLYSAVWEHDPNLRKLIFIVPAGKSDTREIALEVIPQDKRAGD